MSRWERTGQRDLFFSGWHRTALPDHCCMIDVDGAEYCRGCQEPIALLEMCRLVVGYKSTTVLAKLAARSSLPAYLIKYDPNESKPGGMYTISRAFIVRVFPTREVLGEFSDRRLAAWFTELHRRHACVQKLATT